MRHVTILTIASLLLVLGCEKDDTSSDDPTPKAVAAQEDTGNARQKDRQMQRPEVTWDETLAIADDHARAPVARYNALKRYVEANEGMAEAPKLEEAKTRMAHVEAHRLVRTTYIVTHEKAQRKAVDYWVASRLSDASLREIGEAVLLGVVADTARANYGDQLDETLLFKTPFGKEIALSRRPYMGLGYLRGRIARTMERASMLLDDGERRRAWTDANMNAWTRNMALNTLLSEHLGGPLFDPEYPGRLQKQPARKLARGFGDVVGDRVLGVPSSAIIRLFEDRLTEYDDAWKEIERVGKKQALSDYRKAYELHSARTEPGKRNGDMLNFYRQWTEQHEIPQQTDRRRYSVKIAVGFWMRRLDDGTAPYFRRALAKALKKL